jgi:thioredoxin 1
MPAIKMTGSEVKEAVKGSGLVILDVYVKIIKMNADENGAEAAEFNVSALPTVIFFKDGVEVDRFMGFRAKPQIEALVDQHK